MKDIEDKPNYIFVKADICDFGTIQELLVRYQVDGIIHLAAESHVDRSIKDPFTFAQTNVMGTLALLQAAKLYWESLPEKYGYLLVATVISSLSTIWITRLQGKEELPHEPETSAR